MNGIDTFQEDTDLVILRKRASRCVISIDRCKVEGVIVEKYSALCNSCLERTMEFLLKEHCVCPYLKTCYLVTSLCFCTYWVECMRVHSELYLQGKKRHRNQLLCGHKYSNDTRVYGNTKLKFSTVLKNCCTIREGCISCNTESIRTISSFNSFNTLAIYCFSRLIKIKQIFNPDRSTILLNTDRIARGK